MTLAPLANAPLVIQLHSLAALLALGLGGLQLAAPKGRLPHRRLGWIWVLLMALVALSSFRIQTIRPLGGFSIIHALSLATLLLLPVAVLHGRRHRVRRHRNAMLALFAGALVLAGVFTLMPGRLMHEVVFGLPAAR